MSNLNQSNPSPHVALLPSSGMGHLTPFLRLAASLSVHNVQVTLITPQTTVSLSESQSLSQFLSVYPQITHMHLNLLQMDTTPSISSEDPFYLRYEAIRRSSLLLPSLLSSLTPYLSALVTDMSLASTVIPVVKPLCLPNYILFSSSAKMLTLFASFHSITDSELPNMVQIPGVGAIPRSWVPPPLLSKNQSLLKTFIIDNGKSFIQSDGILINSCESIEGETLEALNNGRVVEGFPKVTAVGPFYPWNYAKTEPVQWLDDQPAGSVLYISFGSKTAMSRDQIRELGDGLVRSGCKFLWVVKEKKVDREDEGGLEEVLGQGFMERVKGLGLVVKNWVNQEEVLGHKAVGGFVSHCGWNSVMEAAWFGVPVLAWPQNADQKMNASVVEKVGLGVWAEDWGWGGGEVVVKSEKIEEKVREILGDGLVKERAERVRDKAREAVEDGGSSEKGLVQVIEMWKKKKSSVIS